MDRTSGDTVEILGVFPSFDSERFGGVQGSGQDAWSSVLDRFGGDRAQALFYKTNSSKAAAILSALRQPRAERILIWHLQLAKLLPVLTRANTRVSIFLHGIEAWRRLDRLT